MRRVRSEDTPPEVQLRKALHAQGVRFRLHCQNLTGRPDIVLPSRKIAIFIDGDLWHGNQWRLRGLRSLEEQFASTANRAYWVAKIRRNQARDVNTTSRLLSEGWNVMRFWESEVKTSLSKCVDTVLRANQQRRERPQVAGHTVAEFFAGIGLMRMGLERAGWSTVYANDNDPKKHQMYLAQFPDSTGLLDPRDVYEVSATDVGQVTLATASFPCNDLSLAGARNGLAGPQSSAFWGFLRIISDMAAPPPLILLENVPGLLTSHKGRDLETILRELNQLGYAVDIFTLDAASFVPQSRRRLFIVAKQEPLGQPGTAALLIADAARPEDVARFIGTHPQIHWSIQTLPPLPGQGPVLSAILEERPDDDGIWWSEERVQYLLSQMSERHSRQVDEVRDGEEWTYFTAFRRVRAGRSMAEIRNDGLAGCLRTPRGGSGRQILVRVGRGTVKARLLSARECARLMGADDFVINVPLNQALFGFGDAVCVPVVKWIAENYLNEWLTRAIHQPWPCVEPACDAGRGKRVAAR